MNLLIIRIKTTYKSRFFIRSILSLLIRLFIKLLTFYFFNTYMLFISKKMNKKKLILPNHKLNLLIIPIVKLDIAIRKLAKAIIA